MLKGTRNTPSKRRDLYPSWLGTSWNKEQNLITIVVHQECWPQPLCLFTVSFDSYSAFLLSFSNSFFLFTQKTKLFSVFRHSFLPSSPVNFGESSDQYIGVSQSLLCCSQLCRCVCVSVCMSAFLITLGTHWSTCSMEVKKEDLFFFLLTSVVAKPTIFASLT